MSVVKVALAASYHFPAAASPPVSCAAAMISKFAFLSSSYSVCQPGRSSRHPHQEAHVTRSTFLPRNCDKRTSVPVRSGTVIWGATRD